VAARIVPFVFFAAVSVQQAGGQTARILTRADSLLRTGHVARAETLYYAAARRDTRDTTARIALGRYLISRGAFRIGSTLLEEALAFGADTARISRGRAPALAAADDWAVLAQLRHTSLAEAEVARAAWLAAQPPRASGADSVTVSFEPSSVRGLGRVRLIVDRDTLAADIDPNLDGLEVGERPAGDSLIVPFPDARGLRTIVVQRAAIGDLVLERVPARIDPELGPARARIGLTLLAKYAPTVDAGAGVLTLRRNGRVAATTRARRIPMLFDLPGIRIARPGGPVPIESPAGRAILAEARWTIDLRRGELVLEVDR
jgi:hypothetical protein